jgi:hypothetical protein
VNKTIFCAAIIAMCGAAHAQQPHGLIVGCAQSKDMDFALRQKYKETPIAGGPSKAENYIAQVYVSPSMTFSIVLSYPDGTSCIVAAGKDWDQQPLPKKGQGS